MEPKKWVQGPDWVMHRPRKEPGRFGQRQRDRAWSLRGEQEKLREICEECEERMGQGRMERGTLGFFETGFLIEGVQESRARISVAEVLDLEPDSITVTGDRSRLFLKFPTPKKLFYTFGRVPKTEVSVQAKQMSPLAVPLGLQQNRDILWKDLIGRRQRGTMAVVAKPGKHKARVLEAIKTSLVERRTRCVHIPPQADRFAMRRLLEDNLGMRGTTVVIWDEPGYLLHSDENREAFANLLVRSTYKPPQIRSIVVVSQPNLLRLPISEESPDRYDADGRIILGKRSPRFSSLFSVIMGQDEKQPHLFKASYIEDYEVKERWLMPIEIC